MTPTPLPLRVSSAPDLAQQQHMHRLTALAKSLHGSHTVMPLRAAQPAPNAPQRGNTAGSVEAARLEAQKAELETRHWRLSKARNAGSVAEIKAANARITELEGQIEATRRALEAVDTGRGAPAGLPYLYRIEVAGLEVTGKPEATYAPEVWTLDTHMLPGELRERLGAYLLGGSDLAPYWHCKKRRRYYATSRAERPTLDLLDALAGHMARPETR